MPIINTAINRKRAGDSLYMVGNGKDQEHLYAEHLAEAKQRAIEHFRPKKKDRGLIWVTPASTPVDTTSL